MTRIVEEKSYENDADFGRIWKRRRTMRTLPELDGKGKLRGVKMEIEYEETPYDLEKSFEYNLKETNTARNYRIIIGLFIILVFIIGILSFLIFGSIEDPLGEPFPFVISFTFLSTIVYFFIKYIVLKRNINNIIAKETIKGKNIKSYLGKNKIRIDSDGLHRSNYYRDEHVRWEGIVKMKSTKEHIFVYDTDLSALIIPIKAFHSTKQKNDFLNELRKYLKDG
ncbi:MAG: YcxB family protein [Candidatus Thermoplasmatota archaeon]|nr:YcxB family protein [Candidatus Thermoplasmatota archaeon]